MLGKKFTRTLEQVISWMATSFLFAFLIAVVLQVFYRYVLKMPLRWSEQAARYLNMYAMFLGAVLVTINRNHLGVDLIFGLLDRFNRKAKLIYAIFINLVIALVLPSLIYGSFYMARDQWSIPLTTMRFLSLGQMYLALLLPASLMLLLTLDHIVTDLRAIFAKSEAGEPDNV
ncbi:MAG: TRAP transporter small permease subunit [Dethiobacter sp.]|jgi:TRAP-type C4-dicarboxylate transport system permease small subunit|nr:TRAP transporter small permease subunit [Dethiobacter sp.]